jgi:hypothetical protein
MGGALGELEFTIESQFNYKMRLREKPSRDATRKHAADFPPVEQSRQAALAETVRKEREKLFSKFSTIQAPPKSQLVRSQEARSDPNSARKLGTDTQKITQGAQAKDETREREEMAKDLGISLEKLEALEALRKVKLGTAPTKQDFPEPSSQKLAKKNTIASRTLRSKEDRLQVPKMKALPVPQMR